jgi:protein-tyrosine phosphatase
VIRNFRDLGGLSTLDGLAIQPGRFFRSAQVTAPAGSPTHHFLNGLGLRRLIDLRTRDEVDRHGSCGSFVERMHLPLLESIEQEWSQPIDRSPPATGRRYYDYLAEGRLAVLEVLRQLRSSRSTPTLIHCVSGRDRTGIAVACVLSVLSVSEETIARDYAESHVVDDVEGRNAHPDNIRYFLRTVRERHGSLEAMLTRDGEDTLPVAELRSALLDR